MNVSVIDFPQSWPHQDLLSRNVHTGSSHENVLTPKAVSSDLRLTDGQNVLVRIEIVAILIHYQPSYNSLHTQWNPVIHCCSPMSLWAAGYILQAKLTYLDTQPSPSSPRVTILSASSVRTMVHCVVKHSRPPDLKSSSNVSLPSPWITGPATDPSWI